MSFLTALAWGWLARHDDATAHDVRCACVACRRFAHGYLKAAQEAQRGEQETKWRRWMAAWEASVER